MEQAIVNKVSKTDIVEQALRKLLNDYGFQTDIIKSISTEEIEGKLNYHVKVDTAIYNDIPFLSEGKIVVLLQSISDKLPGLTLDKKPIEWIFEPDQKIEASIIDYPRKSLDPVIWDLSEETPKLKEDIKKEVLQTFEAGIQKKFPDIDWKKQILKYNLVGSAGTYQYVSSSDIDIHIIVEDPKQITDEIQDYVRDELSGWKIEKHPVNYYLQLDKKQDMLGDALYEIDTGTWVISPKKMKPEEFEPEKKFEPVWIKTKDWMDKFIKGLGELQRDIKDVEELEHWLEELSDGELKWLEKRIENKISEVNKDLDEITKQFTEVHEERKKAYSEHIEPEEILQDWQESKSTLPGNVQWKILEKYGLVSVLANLRYISKSKTLTDEEKTEEAKKVLERFNLMFDKVTTEGKSLGSIVVGYRKLGLDRSKVDSSNIKAVGYDAEKQILEVEFTNGSIYQYTDVPKEIYDGFMGSDSKGSYFYHNIRKSFEYKKLEARIPELEGNIKPGDYIEVIFEPFQLYLSIKPLVGQRGLIVSEVTKNVFEIMVNGKRYLIEKSKIRKIAAKEKMTEQKVIDRIREIDKELEGLLVEVKEKTKVSVLKTSKDGVSRLVKDEQGNYYVNSLFDLYKIENKELSEVAKEANRIAKLIDEKSYYHRQLEVASWKDDNILTGSIIKKAQYDTAEAGLLNSGVVRLGEELLKHPIAVDAMVGFWVVKHLVDSLNKDQKPEIPQTGFWTRVV